MPSTNRHSGRSAAVTGAGGGLGRDIALGLAAKGYVVFGTAMSAVEVQDLKDASGGHVSLTVCDMTKEESVKAWAASVSDALGDSGLDILINNAGILTPGPIEVLPLEAIRREFDVNVFGALSVMNAFLPALRKARGRIVQVSTWTASVPLPFNGPCIEGCDGGVCDGLPRRTEAARHRPPGGRRPPPSNPRPLA